MRNIYTNEHVSIKIKCSINLIVLIFFLSSCSFRTSSPAKPQFISYELSSFGVISEAVLLDMDTLSQKIYRNSDFRKGGKPNSTNQIPQDDFKEYRIKNKEKMQNALLETGIMNWKSEYIEKDAMDGYQWGITIIYEDGTKKSVVGSNDAPKQFNQLKAILFSSKN